MRCVREILRLKAEGLSDRAIARSTGLARSTVSEYAGRARAAGLIWPLPDELTDTALEALLFVGAGIAAGTRRKPEPDWAHLHRRAAPPRRHADAVVAGVPGEPA
jgi:transposase